MANIKDYWLNKKIQHKQEVLLRLDKFICQKSQTVVCFTYSL